MEERLLALPVSNGFLPRPGGYVSGIFLAPWLVPAIARAGVGVDIFVMPLSPVGEPYPVGMVAKVDGFYMQEVYVPGRQPPVTQGIFLRLYGREHARARTFSARGRTVIADGVELLPVQSLRPDYPCISGAGWVPQGGYTEFQGAGDTLVTVYGMDLMSGNEVSIQGNVGRYISYQQAHTVEHALIRALTEYSFCSPKTLAEAITAEGRELIESVEAGMQLGRPELFGVTASGACGNPLTQLAQFYMADEYLRRLQEGHSAFSSLEEARRSTMSRLTADLSLTTEAGLRALQGLKRGMHHDDSTLSGDILKKVLAAFPPSPWH